VITHSLSTDPRSGDQFVDVYLERVPPIVADAGDRISIDVTGNRFVGKVERRRPSVLRIRCQRSSHTNG
jgi:hypothetical protein